MPQQNRKPVLKKLLSSTAIVTQGSHSQGQQVRLSDKRIAYENKNTNGLGDEWLDELVERGRQRSVVDNELRDGTNTATSRGCDVVQDRTGPKKIFVLGGNPVQRVPRGQSKIKKHFQRSKFKNAKGRCGPALPETYNHYREVYEDDDLLLDADDGGARTEMSKGGLGWEGAGTSTLL